MIDVEKLTKSLKAATPEQFAKYVDQTIERLKKAADHLGKAASQCLEALEIPLCIDKPPNLQEGAE